MITIPQTTQLPGEREGERGGVLSQSLFPPKLNLEGAQISMHYSRAFGRGGGRGGEGEGEKREEEEGWGIAMLRIHFLFWFESINDRISWQPDQLTTGSADSRSSHCTPMAHVPGLGLSVAKFSITPLSSSLFLSYKTATKVTKRKKIKSKNNNISNNIRDW